MNMAFNDESTPAQALVACRVCLCLATTGKMYCFETAELKKDFFNITGLEVSPGDGLPQHMCHICCGLLRKATEFRNKCHSTLQLLSSHPVTLKFIQNIHGQPSQNTDVVSAKFDSNLLDLQLDAERDTQNHLNKEKTEENHKYFQSDVHCDIQNHVNKEDLESDLPNSQDDTDIKWATDDNLNDNDQSDGEYTTVVDDELDSIVDKADDETKSIPLGEIKSVQMDTMDIQFTSNERTVKYSKMLHQYIQEKYVSKTLEPDSLVSDRIEFYNFLKQKYDYDGNYMDEVENHSVSLHANKYNFKVEYFCTTEERIENLRTRMHTNKYKQAKFKCTDCYTGFASEQKFKEHRERHDSAEHGSVICEVCKLRYSTKAKLGSHQREVHNKKLTCNQCGESVPGVCIAKLKEHFDCSSGSKYECEHCPYVASKKASLLQHVYRKHGTVPCSICHFMMLPHGVDRHMKRQHAKTFTCSSCCKVFNAYAAIAKHIHTLPGGVCRADAWPCTKCGRNYRTASELRVHIDRIHRRRKRKAFTCSSCDKVFNEYAVIERHIHTSPGGVCGADAWPCTHCGDNFNTESDLRRHTAGCRKTRPKRTKTASSYRYPVRIHKVKKIFACTECPKTFSRKAHLKEHTTVHTGERPHRCSQCEKTYTRPTSLYNHCKIIHENHRPHECTICRKKFPRAANLRIHINAVHKRELPLETQRKIKKKEGQQMKSAIICEWCGKAFLNQRDYRKHALTHTGERAHACPECPEAFRTKQTLKNHSVVHTSMSAHRCPQCGRTFTVSSSLKTHIKTVHENLRPHECPVCSKKFYQPFHRDLHVRTVHKTDVKREKKVGGGVKKVGGGVKKVGRGVNRVGKGVKKKGDKIKIV